MSNIRKMHQVQKTHRRTLIKLFLVPTLVFLAFFYTVNHLAHKSIPRNSAGTGDIYYFAYGSNMSSRYLYNMRNVLPVRSEFGYIEDYQVSIMQPGINFLEPGFAQLHSAMGNRAYGVVHRISKKELSQIASSEGEMYRWRKVSITLQDGNSVLANTLVGDVSNPIAKPSKRYINIMIEGAREHDLPVSYIKKLANIDSTYYAVASELMGAIVHAVVMISS